MSYQDLWRDGQLVKRGERSCVDRYEAIKGVLSILDQPFTVLDLGAAEGYFSARLVEDFDCRVTAIDSNPKLRELASRRIDVVPAHVSVNYLRRLQRHDVVLALSVLHQIEDWRAALQQLQACRRFAIIETPHPSEGAWMRHSVARHELADLRAFTVAIAGSLLGEYPRVGRNGQTYQRGMYLVPGTVRRFRGHVFSGSGSNQRQMRKFGTGLEDELAYEPFWGSLNLRLDKLPDLGKPAINWIGRSGKQTRDYQFWRAWLNGLPCHAMVPGARSHGPDTLELVAPGRLRDRFILKDGDPLEVDIEIGR